MLLWDRIREYDMDHRKKKIGILTFQRAVNYGASLQMYALQKTVKELGAEAEIIDYDCPRISGCYQAVPLRALVHSQLFVGSDQVWNPLITGGDSAYFSGLCEGQAEEICVRRELRCVFLASGISVCGENARRFPGDLHP